MEEVEFYRDAVVQLSRTVEALWGLNITVLLAALGWGLTSRSWDKGLGAVFSALAALVLITFFAINTLALGNFYDRATDASHALNYAWGELHGHQAPDIGYLLWDQVSMDTPLGPLTHFTLVTFVLEACAACGVGLLLSNVGRRRA